MFIARQQRIHQQEERLNASHVNYGLGAQLAAKKSLFLNLNQI